MFWGQAECPWGWHPALGSALSGYNSVGVCRQGGCSLGHHVLPAGLGMGWHPQVSQIHQAQSLVLSTAASTLRLPHFLRGACVGATVLGHK